jgi:hypothetical protein
VKKCYNKPNRSRIRYFTVCDAARIADEARQQSSANDVLAAVGRRLGYKLLVDGSKFTEATVVEEIETAIKILDLAGVLVLLIPGSVVWKAVLFVIRQFTKQFAIIIAPIVLALISKNQVRGGTLCNFDNER